MVGDVRQLQRGLEPDVLADTTESMESLGMMPRQAPPRRLCQDTMTGGVVYSVIGHHTTPSSQGTMSHAITLRGQAWVLSHSS